MILAVSRAAQSGNMVIFGADKESLSRLANQSSIDPNMIVNKKTMNRTKMEYKDGLYKVPLWVKKSISSESVNEGMGVGNIDRESETCGSYERSVIDETF